MVTVLPLLLELVPPLPPPQPAARRLPTTAMLSAAVFPIPLIALTGFLPRFTSAIARTPHRYSGLDKSLRSRPIQVSLASRARFVAAPGPFASDHLATRRR